MSISKVFSRRNRILLRELVATDFKLRYQGSFIGYLWSLLKPLFLFAILYFVFGTVMQVGKGIPHYAVYLLFGIVLWNFFSEATTRALTSVVERGDLIRKISFPKSIIVVASTISALINLGFSLVVVVFFAIINGVDISWAVIMVIPLILEIYVFALAVSLFLAALNVKLRDTSFIWDIIMQAAFYATPIIYPVSMLLGLSHGLEIAKILLLMPTAQAIQDARYFLVGDSAITLTDLYAHKWVEIVPIILVFICLSLGAWYFTRKSKKFAENV